MLTSLVESLEKSPHNNIIHHLFLMKKTITTGVCLFSLVLLSGASTLTAAPKPTATPKPTPTPIPTPKVVATPTPAPAPSPTPTPTPPPPQLTPYSP